MAAIGSMRKKLTGFSDEGDDDYGSAGMYFNPSMFPPHRPEKEVFLCCRIYYKRKQRGGVITCHGSKISG